MPSSLSQQQQQQQLQQQKQSPLPRCQECGDVDTDTRTGAAVCRRCADEALAQVAHTD